MILARSQSSSVLGIVTGLLGAGGILGGILVSLLKLPKNNQKVMYLSAALSFLFGDITMGLGQNVYIWSLGALFASVPIPFILAAQNVMIYHWIPAEIQGQIFAVRNAIQFGTIPVGILLGGFLADYVFEPFMESHVPLALFLTGVTGDAPGKGMAVMFLCTGILGFSSSIFWMLKPAYPGDIQNRLGLFHIPFAISRNKSSYCCLIRQNMVQIVKSWFQTV